MREYFRKDIGSELVEERVERGIRNYNNGLDVAIQMTPGEGWGKKEERK